MPDKTANGPGATCLANLDQRTQVTEGPKGAPKGAPKAAPKKPRHRQNVLRESPRLLVEHCFTLFEPLRDCVGPFLPFFDMCPTAPKLMFLLRHPGMKVKPLIKQSQPIPGLNSIDCPTTPQNGLTQSKKQIQQAPKIVPRSAGATRTALFDGFGSPCWALRDPCPLFRICKKHAPGPVVKLEPAPFEALGHIHPRTCFRPCSAMLWGETCYCLGSCRIGTTTSFLSCSFSSEVGGAP